MNINKYGIWILRDKDNIWGYPIYTRGRIVSIENGKYVIQPTHLDFPHLVQINPKDFYVIERKNS